MEVSALHQQVSKELFFARRAPVGSQESKDAYRRVSFLEERLADLIAVTELEGVLARVGSITAAIRTGDVKRATQLIEKFQVDAPELLLNELLYLAGQLAAVDGG